MFGKILIANRGEIAVRIIRACREMGISTVAVFSEADAEELHTALADEKICIGPARADQSYLQEERIISAALSTGANAIHPGYGFLSESAHFAALCEKNGIAFIGPDAGTMEKLSDKALTKEKMAAAGLNVIPGAGIVHTAQEARKAAQRIGMPVMLKARSGGGGRGIRLLESGDDPEHAYALSAAEALKAFGDSALYIEKYIPNARHIEVQILCDEEGNVVCLGERDCSVQRNHQKLIEETPSPGVSDTQRRTLIRRVSSAMKKIGYCGVGTLEFLLDGKFWFMEMNVRLQVEHGVTEMLTGIDLVKWQIRTAAGVQIRFAQKQVPLTGCAIECRINAASTGTVTTLNRCLMGRGSFHSIIQTIRRIPSWHWRLILCSRRMRRAICQNCSRICVRLMITQMRISRKFISVGITAKWQIRARRLPVLPARSTAPIFWQQISGSMKSWSLTWPPSR